MHVEPLDKLPRSVRDFLSHYAMIVLSILTALALEQVALSIDHRHEGNRAKQEIEQEIAANRATVDESVKLTTANAVAWRALLARAVVDAKSGKSTDESRTALLVESSRLFGDSLPTLKTTAWDAALSDHSVNYLSHDDLTRYSELYATQRLFSQAMWDTIRETAVRDITSISLGMLLEKTAPDAAVAVLNSRMRTVEITLSQLRQVDEMLKGSVAAAPTPASAASH